MPSPASSGPPTPPSRSNNQPPPNSAPAARAISPYQPPPRAWLFPLTLFVFATLFLGGDLGLWYDDYTWAQRDVVTEEIVSWTKDCDGHFWRPLHFLLTTALFTAFYHDTFIIHIINALAHGGAALLLWRLLLALGRSPQAAAAGAILFAVYPATFQVIFWPSALSTGIATSIILILYHLALRCARATTPRFLLLLPLFPLLAFAAACFNEQPVACLTALPLFTLAALPPATPRRRTLARITLPSLAAFPAVATYLALYITTNPTGYGTPKTLPTREFILSSLSRYAREIRREMRLHDFVAGALTEGASTLAASPLPAILFLGMLAATAVPFIRWWYATPSDGEPGFNPRLVATLRVRIITAAAAITAFISAWLPIIGTGYAVDSRLCYAPAAAAVILLTLVADSIAGPIHRRPRCPRLPRTAGLALLLPLALIGSICLLGVQSAMRTRYRLDVQHGQQLRALVPNPAPDTVFLPLRIAHRATDHGAADFDDHFGGGLSVPWSTFYFIKRLYRRADLHCNFYYPWHSLSRLFSIYRADADGITIHEAVGGPFPPDPRGGCRVPWASIIPFEITPSGDVRLITRIIAEQPDGPPLRIDIPQLAGHPSPQNPFRLACPPAATRVP